jgi:hypothetical protein
MNPYHLGRSFPLCCLDVIPILAVMAQLRQGLGQLKVPYHCIRRESHGRSFAELIQFNRWVYRYDHCLGTQ